MPAIPDLTYVCRALLRSRCNFCERLIRRRSQRYVSNAASPYPRLGRAAYELQLHACFPCATGGHLLSRRRVSSPVKSSFRNVWSAAELQAVNEGGSWSAPMYSAFDGVSDSGP